MMNERQDWASSKLGHVEGEEKPVNMPQPRGQVFRIRAKVDADHASDTITQRSRTRSRTTPRMYLNSAP